MKALPPPLFESALLHGIATAIEGRGKAIRYHGKLQCSRVVEDSGERLNADFTAQLHFRVRLSIWADGIFWLGVTVSGPRRSGGWAHCDEFHGQLQSQCAREVLERFEQTIHSPAEARSFWPPPPGDSGNA